MHQKNASLLCVVLVFTAMWNKKSVVLLFLALAAVLAEDDWTFVSSGSTINNWNTIMCFIHSWTPPPPNPPFPHYVYCSPLFRGTLVLIKFSLWRFFLYNSFCTTRSIKNWFLGAVVKPQLLFWNELESQMQSRPSCLTAATSWCSCG